MWFLLKILPEWFLFKHSHHKLMTHEVPVWCWLSTAEITNHDCCGPVYRNAFHVSSTQHHWLVHSLRNLFFHNDRLYSVIHTGSNFLIMHYQWFQARLTWNQSTNSLLSYSLVFRAPILFLESLLLWLLRWCIFASIWSRVIKSVFSIEMLLHPISDASNWFSVIILWIWWTFSFPTTVFTFSWSVRDQ